MNTEGQQTLNPATVNSNITASDIPAADVTPLPTTYESRAKTATIFVGLMALAEALMAVVSLLTIQNPEALLKEPSTDEAMGLIAFTSVAGLVLLAVGVGTVITWLLWLNATVKAVPARALGTRRWMVMWGYFIPFANIVLPGYTMKQLYAAPERETAYGEGNPAAEQKRPLARIPGVITAWGALWAIMWMTGGMVNRLSMRADTADQVITAEWLSIAHTTLVLACAICAIYVIRTVTAKFSTHPAVTR